MRRPNWCAGKTFVEFIENLLGLNSTFGWRNAVDGGLMRTFLEMGLGNRLGNEIASGRLWAGRLGSMFSAARLRGMAALGALVGGAAMFAPGAMAQGNDEPGGEASLRLPDLSSVRF